jgi:hypothetical protein
MMRRRTALAAMGIIVMAAGTGLAIFGGGAARRGCRDLESWWLWGGNPPPPLSDNGRIYVELPSDTAEGGTLAGTIRYRNGHRGYDGARDLPARFVAVYAGGVTVAIEDARWWRPAEDAPFLRPEKPSLVASIRCSRPGKANRILANQVHTFEPGRPVELALDFEVTLKPEVECAGTADADEAPIRFAARLGGLTAQGQQQLDPASGQLTPALFPPKLASVSVVMVHAERDTSYADVSLAWNGRPLEVTDCCEDRGTWRLAGEGQRVAARSLISGSLAP